MEHNTNGNNEFSIKKTAAQKTARDIIILVLVFALVAATAFYLGRTYFESWPILGTSMEPTIHNNDRVVLVKKRPYDYDYDDIVIFKTPAENNDSFSGKYLIKRVIGKPGDRIQTVFYEETGSWHVLRNGEIVTEKHIKEAITEYTALEEVVPEGHYFVLGDNRNNSHDSHIAGFYAEADEIIGKVFVRYKSISDFSFLF